MNATSTIHEPSSSDHLSTCLFDLLELHGQLIAVESKRAVGSARKAIVFGALAAVVGLASVPVALLAIAYALVDAYAWSLPIALVASAGIGATFSVVCALVTFHNAKRCGAVIHRIGGDLQQSFIWLRVNLTR